MQIETFRDIATEVVRLMGFDTEATRWSEDARGRDIHDPHEPWDKRCWPCAVNRLVDRMKTAAVNEAALAKAKIDT